VDAPADCVRCPRLVESRRCVVNGYGDPHSYVWAVGQGPGRREEEQGRPFCGWSGEKLDYLLGLAGIVSVRYENVTRCRPPRRKTGDAPPSTAEIDACRSYLLAALAESPPELVIAVGAPAGKWFAPALQLSRDHGRWFTWQHPETNESITVVPMYHPASAHPTRNPSLAQVLIEDFKRIQVWFGGPRSSDRDYQAVDSDELSRYLEGVK
jgi:DNA polymerase